MKKDNTIWQGVPSMTHSIDISDIKMSGPGRMSEEDGVLSKHIRDVLGSTIEAIETKVPIFKS